MSKVRAISRGYFGGIVREVGDVFDWPSDRAAAHWVEPVAFGGKGDHDGDGLTGGSKPKTDGDEKPAKGKRGRRKAVTKDAPSSEPFEDGDGDDDGDDDESESVTQALGGPAPDWIAPGTPHTPVMADE